MYSLFFEKNTTEIEAELQMIRYQEYKCDHYRNKIPDSSNKFLI